MSGDTHFDRVALIGLGLIGSSLGHAMKRAGLACEIVGSARSETTRARSLEIGFIDRAEARAADAVNGGALHTRRRRWRCGAGYCAASC